MSVGSKIKLRSKVGLILNISYEYNDCFNNISFYLFNYRHENCQKMRDSYE